MGVFLGMLSLLSLQLEQLYQADEGTPLYLRKKFEAVLATKPLYGELALDPSGSFVYTHDGSENRIDTFTYSIKDANDNESKPASVIIKNTNVNDGPTTVADFGTVVSSAGTATP